MAYGSLIHGFSRINQGKGISLEAFEIASDKLFDMAQKYACQAYNSVARDESVDIPMKHKKSKK
jgi:hypothetical protein